MNRLVQARRFLYLSILYFELRINVKVDANKSNLNLYQFIKAKKLDLNCSCYFILVKVQLRRWPIKLKTILQYSF